MLDLARGLRALKRRPGFTVAAILMLALGIGANAAVFAVNEALSRGFANVEQNDRLVQVTTTRGFIYYPDFEEWRARTTSFEEVALVRGVFHTWSDASGLPETYFATEVTANTFQMLHVTPMLGRDFSLSDTLPGAEAVVILRYEFWVRRFRADPAAIGLIVHIDGRPARVIGVMPRAFSFPTRQDLWTPLVPTTAALRRETGYAQYAYARLRERATVPHARAEMETIARQLANAFPSTNHGLAPVVKSFEEWFIGDHAKALYRMIWAAAGFVLLAISANIANVFVEHANGRSREIAIRLALGASRAQVIQPFLFEALTLAAIGGVIGWWLARAGVAIYALIQSGSPPLSVTMDSSVLAYLIATTVGSAFLANTGAAIQLTRLKVASALTNGSRGMAVAGSGKSVSDLFVGAQVTLAVVLLAGTAVIVRSVLNVYTAHVGADTAHLLTMSLYAAPERYSSAEARVNFYRDLTGRLQALPGVTSVAFGTAAPTEYTPRVVYQLEGASALDDTTRPAVAEFVASPAYFRTLRVSVIAGREFTSSDQVDTQPVAIVNQQFARRNWPNEDPIGKRVRLFVQASQPTPWLTVVGLVTNVIQNDRLRQVFDPVVYVPYEQQPQPNMFAFVRTEEDPRGLLAGIQRQLYAMDAYLPVPALGSVDERFELAYSFERNGAVLILCFAVLTVLVASLGLYATVSRSVTAREAEIGVRRALGATATDIVTVVFARVFNVVAIGWFIGLMLSVVLVRIARTQLVGVSPADPAALAVASAILAASAALGGGIPAARATRMDPWVALKRE